MKKVKSTDAKIETPEVENTEVETKEEGLSLREALEVAFEGTKDDPKEGRADNVVNEAKDTEGEVSASEKPTSEPAYEPPGEYTPEEKADFLQLSRKGQEAQLRLDKSRKARLDEIRREGVELSWAKELAREAEPFIKSTGGKLKPHEAIIAALKLRNEMENGDPKKIVSDYLRAKGLKVPKDLEADSPSASNQEQNNPLLARLNSVESKLAQKEQSEKVGFLSQQFAAFEQEKNAGGSLKYPDLTNTESGLRLAASIGSLVGGETALSKEFIADAKARIPDLTYPKLFEEAYRIRGGKVDDFKAPKTQDTQKHIANSRRAASSVPGRGAPQTSSGKVKKFKTYREAAAAALADINGAEG